ncbi:nucleotidyltransferase family protein [Candidatus Parvarchaeota archaeon]|nr:nucleotidyltransferase family protein [Candidatus Parvarchaeota archaeon]
MIREAVILAAGEGKRMKTGTKEPTILNTPKPLLEIGGKPIISRKIEKLLSAGFKVIVVVNHKNKNIFAEKLKNFPVEYCLQGSDSGTAAALFAAKDAINEDLFLVLMGDDISDIDLERLKASESPIVFGFEVEDVSTYGFIVANETGDITEILEKQKTGRGLANTGIYIMPKSFFDIYTEIKPDPKNGERYLTAAIKPLISRGIKFHVEKIPFWFGINTPEQLKEAERYFHDKDINKSGNL